MTLPGRAGQRRAMMALLLAVCLSLTATVALRQAPSPDSPAGSAASFLFAPEAASTPAFLEGKRKRNAESNDLPETAALTRSRPLRPLSRCLNCPRPQGAGLPQTAHQAATAIRAPPATLSRS